MTFTIGLIVGMVGLLTAECIVRRKQLHEFIRNQAMLARMERIAHSSVMTGDPRKHSEKVISSLQRRVSGNKRSLQERVRGNERGRTDQYFAA